VQIARNNRFASSAFLFYLLCAPACAAQFSNLDHLGEDLAKQLKSNKPLMVAVADFVPSGGAVTDQGHYFSSFLTLSVQYYGKELPIVAHQDFDKVVTDAKLSSESLAELGAAGQLSGKIPEDILVVGSIQKDAQSYNFAVSAIRVSDGNTLFSQRTSFKRTEFIDSLSESFRPKLDAAIFRAGVSGTDSPVCLHCPITDYNEYARRDKLQGTLLLDVVISPEGKPFAIHPVRMLGDGLDQEAFNSVKDWRLKPAKSAQGQPVWVIVTVEISFHLN